MRVTDVILGGHAYQPKGRHISAIRSTPYDEVINGLHPDFETLTMCPYPNQPTIDYTAKAAIECYAPCAREEILDHMGAYDFAPSTLDYLAARFPKNYRRIIQSDKINQQYFNGHGNAIATLYDHLIAPFASNEVKQIQIAWGEAAFEHNYGRKPEGIWYPEGAIDRPTVEISRDKGMKFTILAPQQALWIRHINDRNKGNDGWEYVGPNNIDTRRPYVLCDESTSEPLDMAAFFINKQLTDKMALSAGPCGTYNSRDSVLHHLKEAVPEGLAFEFFDLETIGHHNGTAPIPSLKEALKFMHLNNYKTGFRLTNLSEYLATHPPEYDVRFIPMSSWSCMWDGVQHRLGRWGDPAHTDCNCGGVWNSEWRRDLRIAMDGLGDQKGLAKKIEDIFFKEFGPKYFKDPFHAAVNYIKVLLGEENLQSFLRQEGKKGAGRAEFEIMYKLLEALTLSMSMNTSCMWFHDGLQRIEPTMNFVAAQSALELLKELPLDGRGHQIEDELLDALSRVRIQDGGRRAYDEAIRANSVEEKPRVRLHRAQGVG